MKQYITMIVITQVMLLFYGSKALDFVEYVSLFALLHLGNMWPLVYI